jgi:exoribonuclease R
VAEGFDLMDSVEQARVTAAGLAAIREQMLVPVSFPAEVVAAAEVAAAATLAAATDPPRVDLTGVGFVTLDPATSMDLDQAFWIDREGDTLVLRYAIADVPAFAVSGGVIEAEAWKRGETIYLPDGKAGVYPAVLSEGAASLLPDGRRPAIVLSVTLDADGQATLRSVERAVIASRAKLAYETATSAVLPAGFDEFARRVTYAEDARGASRVQFPEQDVVPDDARPGCYRLQLRTASPIEDANAAMSLSANLALADAMFKAGTGLFRVMDAPDGHDVAGLHHVANALGISWPATESLLDMQKRLDATKPHHQAMLLAIRRAGGGASYEPLTAGVTPWHAAMAATYAHTTAPLRRLADRYVLEAGLAISARQPIPSSVTAAFSTLHDVMEAAEQKASKVDHAVIELLEAVTLSSQVGQPFRAVVIDTDKYGAKIQLLDEPVIVKLDADHLDPGQQVVVTLLSADPVARKTEFRLARRL